MKYACEYCLTLFDEEYDCTSHEHDCEGNPDAGNWALDESPPDTEQGNIKRWIELNHD